MSQPPLNTNKMLLQSAAMQVLSSYHRLAYAHIGSDLTIIQTSDNFSFLLPEDMETAEGRPLTEVISEFAGTEEQLNAVLNEEMAVFALEQVNRELAGANQYFNLRVANLDTLNGRPGLLLIVEDVTNSAGVEQQLARHRTEQQQMRAELSAADKELKQLNQFKSFLLSMLAHDMRTPLAAIRGYAELLLRLISSDRVEVFSTKAMAFADNICNITDQMTWLIRDIIDLDQAEKGVLAISAENCDIHAVIQDTISMMDSIIRLQNITLLLELDPPDLFVAADPQRMRQIMNNLVGNAIKRTPSGGEIAVSTQVENGEAILAVTDNGRGMTAEQSANIFQPYHRSKESGGNILGSGLGLYIVKSLVEAQNGRVEVASEVGRGSTFTVYLPLAQAS